MTNWWKFDNELCDLNGDAGTTHVKASIGDAHFFIHGTDAFTDTDGEFINGTHALDLDGTDDWLETSDDGTGHTGTIGAQSTPFTICGWARPLNSAGASSFGLYGFIPVIGMSKTPLWVAIAEFAGFYCGGNPSTGSGYLVGSMKAGTTQESHSFGSGSFIVGDWHFMAMVWDESTNQLVYYLGRAGTDANPVQATDATSGSMPTSIDTAWITGGYASNELEGQYDDVRLYNAALSEAEIQAIYNGGDGESY